jgi:hypothetical protein
VLTFFIAGLLVYLCFEHVESLQHPVWRPVFSSHLIIATLGYNSAQGGSQLRYIVLAVCLLSLGVSLNAQHGTAPNGYFPMGYAGDTWTGEVRALDDAKREITLLYKGKKGDETFVGVVQPAYQVKLKDGKLAELKLGMIPLGTRLTVYYMAKNRKVDGRKEKFYEIFRIEFPQS